MKKLLFALLLLPFITKAQVKTKLYVGGPLATNVYRGPLGSDSALYIMAGCDSPANVNVSGFYGVYRGALIYKDTCNDAIYTSNPDESWTRIINSSGDIFISGDTVVINKIRIKNLLSIPLTDTTNAIKGCGNMIYDTIREHFYGDVCINGTHYAWQCFDCVSGVTDWSAGTTGFTPNTATTGSITLAGTLNETHGGTNQTTYTTGDMLYASGANTLSKLPIGTASQHLVVVGGLPAWRDTAAASGYSLKVYQPFKVSNDSLYEYFNVIKYGAYGDGAYYYPGVSISSGTTTLTSAGSLFASTDVGKTVIIFGAGAAGGNYQSTISAFTSPTQVTVALAASTTVTNVFMKWGHDDATAINNAITAAVNTKAGGVVYFPLTSGFYLTTSQITIPTTLSTSADSMPHIVLRGEVPPNDYTDWASSRDQPQWGVIILNASTGTGAAIASAAAFNFTQVTLENLTIRVRSKSAGTTHIAPVMTALNAADLEMIDIWHCRFDTESPQDSSVAPASTAYGIKTPTVNNWAHVNLNDVLIQNFYYGMTVNEHVTGDNITISTCQNAMQFLSGYHTSHFNRALLIWNINHLVIDGTAHFKFDDLDLEDYNPPSNPASSPSRWFTTATNLLENSGSSTGEIYYQRTIANVGLDNTFLTASTNDSIMITRIGYPYNKFRDYIQVKGSATGGTFDSVARFRSQANIMAVVINANAAGKQPTVLFQSAGANLHAIGSNYTSGDKKFFIYDYKNVQPKAILDSAGNWFFSDGVISAATNASIYFSGTNLGVGITPTFKLHVAGTARFTDDVSGLKSINGNYGFTAENTSSSTSAAGAFIAKNNSGNTGIVFKLGSGYTTFKNLVAQDFGFYTATGNISILNDNSSGNINFNAGSGASAQVMITSGGSLISGTGVTSAVYRTTNAGSDIISKFSTNTGGSIATAGSQAFMFDNTNGLVFGAANGTREIARAAIKLTGLTNTAGSEVGDLSIYAQTGGAAINEVFRHGAKNNRAIVRMSYNKGADVAAANDLTLGTDGNVFSITGATTVNAITTADWVAGSEIILIFASNPTVKNNTAGGAGTATMLLAGGVDFSATANDILRLVYNGTNWIEVSRSVN